MKSLAEEQGIKLTDAPTFYGESSWSEFWAESFAAYVHSRQSFEKNHNKAYKFFIHCAKEYGIDLSTVKEAK